MENITSLNSPHIERVKALIGSRGKKNRELENSFIAEGIQAVREALIPKLGEGLAVKQVYVILHQIFHLYMLLGIIHNFLIFFLLSIF